MTPGIFPAGPELLPMQEGDLGEVMAVELRVMPYPWGNGHFSDCLRAGYACWICRSGGEFAGYFVVMPSVDEAHLLTIGVAEKFQGRGFGALLLRHAMTTASAAGCNRLLLEVRPSNTPALGLYRHFGFAEIGRRKGYYPAATGREDALVLARSLEEITA